MKMFKTLFVVSAFIIFSCSDDNIIENQKVNQIANLTSSNCPTEALFDQCINVPEELGLDISSGIVTITQGQINDLMENVIDMSQGVTLYFPAGTYQVGSNGLSFFTIIDNDPEPNDIIGFENGLEIVGDGDTSVFKLIDINNGCSTRLINIRNSTNVTIHNLSFNGNRDNFDCGLIGGSSGSEQANNIRIRNSIDITIDNITSINSNGDALNVGCSSKIIIRNSQFDNCSRNGITFGFGGFIRDEEGNIIGRNPCPTLDDLRITNNIFGSGIDTQQIDFEGAEAYTNIIIRFNTFLALDQENGDSSNQLAISISGVRNDFEGSTNSGIHARILNNEFNQNSIIMRSSNFINFNNNYGVGHMEIDRNSSNIQIARNEFDIILTGRITNIPTPAGNNLRSGILIRLADTSDNDGDGLPDRQISNIVLQTNHIVIQEDFLRAIEVEDATAVTLRNNTIINNSDFIEMVGVRLEARRVDTEVTIVNPGEITGFNDVLQIVENSNFQVGVTCSGNGCDD